MGGDIEHRWLIATRNDTVCRYNLRSQYDRHFIIIIIIIIKDVYIAQVRKGHKRAVGRDGSMVT